MGEHVEGPEVETVFTAKDLMASTLSKIIGAGNRINEVFDHSSEVLGGLASVAAVVGGSFSLEKAIDSTTEYMRSIDRISVLTGMSTQHTDALLESMEMVGIEGQSAERVLLSMSRRTESMEMHMNALGQETGTTAMMLRRMGVDTKHGPEKSFESMARAVQKNKLGVAELGIAFGIPRNETIDLYKLLQKGPEHIRENIKEAERYGVTIGDLTAYRRIHESQEQIKSSWKRINLIVGSELMPLIGEFLDSGAKKMRGWVEHAREFGTTLSHFLREHYDLVIKTGKVLLANFAIQRLTGAGLGSHLLGLGEAKGGEGGEGKRGGLSLIPRVLGFVSGGFNKSKREGHPLAKAASKETAEVAGSMIGRLGKSMAGMVFKAGTASSTPILTIMSFFKSLGGSLLGIGSFLLGVVKVVLSVAGRLGIVGAIVMVIYGAFRAIRDNVLGIRTYFSELWDRILLRFHGISIALQPLFSIFNVFSSNGVVGNFFSRIMVGLFHGLGSVVEGILSMVHTLIRVLAIIKEDGLDALSRPVLLWKTAANAAKADMAIAARMERERKARDAAQDAVKRQIPTTRDRQPNFDFRGSRFDIKQAFSDMDPDRIAVAFANDLAGLGERKVQSSFAPLWSV